jgi:hypothetical protein
MEIGRVFIAFALANGIPMLTTWQKKSKALAANSQTMALHHLVGPRRRSMESSARRSRSMAA